MPGRNTFNRRPTSKSLLTRKLSPPELLELRAAPSGLAMLGLDAEWWTGTTRDALSGDASAAAVSSRTSSHDDESQSDDLRSGAGSCVGAESDSLGTDHATGKVEAAKGGHSRRIRDQSLSQWRRTPTSDADRGFTGAFQQLNVAFGHALTGTPSSTRGAAPTFAPRQPYASLGGSGATSIYQPSYGPESAGKGAAHSSMTGPADGVVAPSVSIDISPPAPAHADPAELASDQAASGDAALPEVIDPLCCIIPEWPIAELGLAAESDPMAPPPLVATVLLEPPPVAITAPTPVPLAPPLAPPTDPGQITDAEVTQLLARAAKATDRTDAIIAIVDRNGRILGVHVEGGVAIADEPTLVYAIDGAVAKARTAAFFANDTAPLTSRTVRFISQSTITEREVESNPNSADPLVRGPGFVAPVGLGGHFPPDVMNTPQVDLFAIEHTNRDSLVHPGVNRVKEPAIFNPDSTISPALGSDDIVLDDRFGADYIAGQESDAPESYGFASNRFNQAQSRGIATLPGGVPLYKVEPVGTSPRLVGGIGVFFPGASGDATFEQGFVPGIKQPTLNRTNAKLVLEAEYTAATVAANSKTIGGMPPVPGFTLIDGRIDLAGIKLEIIGPHPLTTAQFLATPYAEGALTGAMQHVTPDPGTFAIGGQNVPEGWLVAPKASASGGLSADDVKAIIDRGVIEAGLVRAAIRLPLGNRTRMVLSVTDLDGTVLGLFRMQDATVFSVDVAVAKARNVTYYAGALAPGDAVDANDDGAPDLAPGVAFTNRTFRYLAEPFFPTGIDAAPPGDFSTLRVPGVDMKTAENLPGVTPTAADFNSTVLGFDAFNPGSNFRQTVSPDGFQNGVVFFPGSTPLYRGTTLVGGLGVSGDGVDQDDVVTFVAAGSFLPRLDSPVVRADEVFVNGVRLPYQKFPRNPHG